MRLAWLFVLLTALAPSEACAQAARWTVTIRAERAEVRAGHEIPITFTVTNNGPGRYEYTDRTYDRSGRMPEYALEVHDDRGARVPDPRSLRGQGWIGGGLSRMSVLEPGESFSRTIPLNLWAHITSPGLYRVRARYHPDTGPAVEAAAIDVRILSRSDAEMARRLEELTSELRAAESTEVRVASIKALMYTGDRRAARDHQDVHRIVARRRW